MVGQASKYSKPWELIDILSQVDIKANETFIGIYGSTIWVSDLPQFGRLKNVDVILIPLISDRWCFFAMMKNRFWKNESHYFPTTEWHLSLLGFVWRMYSRGSPTTFVVSRLMVECRRYEEVSKTNILFIRYSLDTWPTIHINCHVPIPTFFQGRAVSFTRCSGINNKQATKKLVSSGVVWINIQLKQRKNFLLVDFGFGTCPRLFVFPLLLEDRMSSPENPFFLTDFKIEPSTSSLASALST